MDIITIILVCIIGLLIGMEGILDEFQIHQPLVGCTLIGLVCNHLEEGIMLGGCLQMIALGWANIGAAVAPDAALASAISSVMLMSALNAGYSNVSFAIALSITIAIPISVIGLYLTGKCRSIAVSIVHDMDKAASNANIASIKTLQLKALLLQGCRVMVPTLLFALIPATVVASLYNSVPLNISNGLAVAVNTISAVGFAIIINVLSNKTTWPFFILGFLVASISSLTLASLSIIGVVLGLIYVYLQPKATSTQSNSSSDPLDDILNDYQ